MRRIWKRLICLVLLAALCVGAGTALSDDNGGPGSLTVTIGNSESKFERKGIQIELYKVADEVGVRNWQMLPEFKEITLPAADASSEAIDDVIVALGDAVDAHHLTTKITGTSDENGEIVFNNLERGVYFGRAIAGPAYLAVQDFFTSVPQNRNGKWESHAVASLKHSYVTPPPTASPSPEPTPPPTPTPTPVPPLNPTPEPDLTPVPPTPTPRPTATPTPTPHKLTIHYVYYDSGEPAAPTYHGTLWPGEEYNVLSPIIPNYWFDIEVVNGTMPGHDVEYTVFYFTKKPGWRYFTFEDYDTALGIGMIQMHVGVCYE